MNKRVVLLILVVPAMQAAGAIGAQARELRGQGYPANLEGGGHFVLADRDGQISLQSLPVPGNGEGKTGSAADEFGNWLFFRGDRSI